MASSSTTPLVIVLAALVGGGAGYFGATLAQSGPELAEVGPDVAALEARIRELESREAEAPMLRGSSEMLGGRVESGGRLRDEVETALLALIENPPPAVAANLRSALAGEEKPEVAEGETPPPGAAEKKILADIEKAIDTGLAEWSKVYPLDDRQIEDLREVARAGLRRGADAKRRGASDREMYEIEVGTQANIRAILGDEIYTDTERRRITNDARKGLTWVSSAVGLRPEQHDQVDRILRETVETSLDGVVRLRSVPLPAEEAAALRAEVGAQHNAGWERIRNEVLTEAQRARIPGK